ncbi:type II secretion system (T2SS) protein G [Sinobacterium caligoides]|uniref:Type II secretion system (T2SS) protein G n=1 Tax=Sinobacterium caligoides TaxID=933926 RepID=A0A3N2DY40_9GAMM|nr:type II secretion system protein GspG [Sinobacterium caligoides]ROS04738.1 type II secretion system (T2SS) protein G [Sinobacterium caligoides]
MSVWSKITLISLLITLALSFIVNHLYWLLPSTLLTLISAFYTQRNANNELNDYCATLGKVCSLLLLSGLSIYTLNAMQSPESRQQRAIAADARTTYLALHRYLIEHQQAPNTMSQLYEVDRYGDPYLEQTLLDPWQQRYRLDEQQGQTVLVSNGPDQKRYSDDDITTVVERSYY